MLKQIKNVEMVKKNSFSSLCVHILLLGSSMLYQRGYMVYHKNLDELNHWPFTEVSCIAVLALAPQIVSPSVTVYCKASQTFWINYSRNDCQHTNLRQLSSLLVGGNRERTSTGSAGIASKPRGQRITIFTPFAEITCTVVPAILLYGLLQLMGTTTTT